MKKVSILDSVNIITDTVSEYTGIRPFLSTGNLNGSIIIDNDYFEFDDKPSRANLNVKEGDIILARMQNTNKVKIITKKEENLIVSTGFIVLRSKDVSFESYLYHLFNSSYFQNKKDRLCTGATQKAINNTNFSKISIPLPPLPQQKAIAAQLDKAQELIQYNEQLIEKYDELQQSLFLDMFGDPVINEKGWEIELIENIAASKKHSIKAGPFGSALKKEFYVEKGYKVYGQEQVIKGDLSYGDYYIDENKYRELESCKVNAGDVLISLVGTYGKVAVIPEIFEKGIINPRLMKISPNIKIIRPDFLKWLLQNESVKMQLKAYSRGGTMDIINVGIVKKIEIILPPLTLQNDFAQKIESIELQKEQAKEALAKSKDIFQGLLQEHFF